MLNQVKTVLSNLKKYRLNSVYISYFLLSFCVVFIFVVIIASITYYYSVIGIKKFNAEKEKETVERIYNNVTDYILQLKQTTAVLNDDNDIIVAMTANDDVSASSFKENIYAINKICKTIRSTDKRISRIYMISNINEFVCTDSSGGYLADYWNKELLSRLQSEVTNKDIYIEFNVTDYALLPNSTIIIAMPVNTGNRYANIVYEINCKEFFLQMYENILSEQDMIFLQCQDKAVGKGRTQYYFDNDSLPEWYHTIANSNDGTLKVGNDDYNYYSSYVNYGGINIMSVLNKRKIETLGIGYILLVTLIILFLSVFISLLISARLFNPINDVLEGITGDNGYTESGREKNEINYILKRFDLNERKIREIKEELSEQIIMLKNAQNAALQSQITPHFLFNTLQSISLMAIGICKGNNEVTQSLSMLADLLSISFRENDLITLRLEIKHAKLYMDLQKKKYGSILTEKWYYDESICGDVLVPKIIIQPLLENAIEHGRLKTGEDSRIEVFIEKREDVLEIAVSDDGKALEETKLTEINTYINEKNKMPNKHIGLMNVNRRIQILYGENYGCRLTREGERMVARVLLPYNES